MIMNTVVPVPPIVGGTDFLGSIPSLRQGRNGLGVNLGHPAAHGLNPLAIVDAAYVSHIDNAGAVGKAIHHIAVDVGSFHLPEATLDGAEHEHDLGDTLVGGEAQGRRAGFQHIVLGGGKAVRQGLIAVLQIGLVDDLIGELLVVGAGDHLGKPYLTGQSDSDR